MTLADGTEIDARLVVSGADPKRTLRLCDPVELNPYEVWRTENIRQPGATAKIDLALSGLPTFNGADDPSALQGRIVVGLSIDHVEKAMDAHKYGHVAEDPVLEATIPSLADPSLAPEGKHVMSILFQAAPRHLREGSWSEERDRLADIAVKSMERFAPGLGELVEARQVITPEDMENDYGLTGGHVYHAEPGLDQFFAWRPLNGEARYQLQIEGPLPGRLGRTPRWRRHRRTRRQRRAADPVRHQVAPVVRWPRIGSSVMDASVAADHDAGRLAPAGVRALRRGAAPTSILSRAGHGGVTCVASSSPSTLSRRSLPSERAGLRRPVRVRLRPACPGDRGTDPARAVTRVPVGASDGDTMSMVRFAEARFELFGEPASLQAFWLDQYGGGIYLSFRDANSGDTTYGGGRYLLDTVKGADLGAVGDRLILDFNFAYQPSCSYDPRWSCPLPPPENTLEVAVPVGERLG